MPCGNVVGQPLVNKAAKRRKKLGKVGESELPVVYAITARFGYASENKTSCAK